MHTHTHTPRTHIPTRTHTTLAQSKQNKEVWCHVLANVTCDVLPKKKEKKTLPASAELPGIVNVINERLRHLAKIFTTLSCQLICRN